MKKLIRHILLLFISLALIWQPTFAKVDFSSGLYDILSQNRNPIPQITIPDYRRIVLNNGLTVYLTEDPQIPALVVKGIIPSGRSMESKKIAGITDCMVDMMATGTQNFSEKEMDHYQEINAIQIDLKADNNYLYFSGNALISEENQLISLIAEILQRPNFNAEYFNRKKNEWESYLKHAKTLENSLVEMYFYNHLMQGHPYSFGYDLDLQLDSLKRITPKSLAEHYQRLIAPNNTILFVYGDFKSDRMEKLINQHFGSWTRTEIKAKPKNVKENKATHGQILLIDKPDATQAKILMGYNFYDQTFLDQNLKERVAFEIANQIYGGGDFESLLMNEIRSKKGYAYDISSDFFNQPLGGAYYISTSVKPDKAYDTIDTIKTILTDLKTGNRRITDTEVFKVVNQRNAFFPEAFRDNDSIINNLIMNVEFKKRDPDYLNQYIKLFNTITAGEAQNAFSKYTFPEKFFTVIVGKKEMILPEFQKRQVAVEVVTLRN